MGALHGYFANVAKAYPKQFGSVWKNVVATDRPEMDDLRRQLWNLRFQYWFRKIDSIGSSWSQAKVDARGVCCALKNPGQLTYKQIGTGFVWGVQIVGAFAFGEIYGRGAIGGYKVGDWWGSPVKAEDHH